MSNKLETWGELHNKIGALTYAGVLPDDISQTHNIPLETVIDILASENMQKYLKRMKEQETGRWVQPQEWFQSEVDAKAGSAIKIMEQVMYQSDSDATRLKAAIEFVDRSTVAPQSKRKEEPTQQQNIIINLSDKETQRINEAMAIVEGEIIDGED